MSVVRGGNFVDQEGFMEREWNWITSIDSWWVFLSLDWQSIDLAHDRRGMMLMTAGLGAQGAD